MTRAEFIQLLRWHAYAAPEDHDGPGWAMYRAADLLEEQAQEIERLRGLFRAEREDNLWNAYNVGHERGGEWTHFFMSDGEWLIREIGLDPKVGHYDAGEVKRLIPLAAARIEGEKP